MWHKLTSHGLILHTGSWFAGLLVLAMFIWITGDILYNGISAVDWKFLTTEPLKNGREGGILPVIVSTLLILLLALIFTIIPGLACAILITETNANHPVMRMLNACLDLLASMPSIVIGLFGNAFFSITLGLGFSILSGALTLMVMMLPLFILSVSNSIRQVPVAHQHSAFCLGLSDSSRLFKVVLPLAIPGIVIGIILSAGRALAETAALLFTSGYVLRMPESILDSGRSLSIHIYDLAMNVPGGNPNSYASAFVLIVILLSINIITIQTGKRLGYYSSNEKITWNRWNAGKS